MEERYLRNVPAITAEEQSALAGKRVTVLGCGGLGGALIEHLARLGVGEITAVDPDRFDATNLNRQILCTEALLGQSKARAALARCAQVNPDVRLLPVEAAFDAGSADALLRGRDLVLDALDSVPARLLLEDACARLGLPIVHGAVQGWMAQVTVAMPGDGALHRLYAGPGVAKGRSVLPFTAAFCAAVQASEAAKLLCARPASLCGQVLSADLQCMDFALLPL